ncbi:hypothetical protein BDW66DRAFT_143298 [Aspergillus desertorum]
MLRPIRRRTADGMYIWLSIRLCSVYSLQAAAFSSSKDCYDPHSTTPARFAFLAPTPIRNNNSSVLSLAFFL